MFDKMVFDPSLIKTLEKDSQIHARICTFALRFFIYTKKSETPADYIQMIVIFFLFQIEGSNSKVCIFEVFGKDSTNRSLTSYHPSPI